MEFRAVLLGEREQLPSLHPELYAARPDLIVPALAGNPEPASPDFPYLFYCLDGRRVAGHVMSFPDVLNFSGQLLPWAWSLGLFTDPDYRRQGIAQSLVESQVRAFAERGIVRGSSFSAPATLRIFTRLEFSMPGFAPRMCLVRRTQPFLRQHIGHPAAVRLGALAADTALSVWRLAATVAARDTAAEARPIGREHFSAFVDGAAKVPHNQHYWGSDAQWFLARCGPHDTLYAVHRPRSQDPCAVLVVRDRHIRKRRLADRYSDFRMMSVMAMRALDSGPDLPRRLVGAVTGLFAQSSADIAEMVTSDAALVQAASRQGFRPLGQGMSFSFIAPADSPLHNLATSPSDWDLSHFCGDGFGYE